MTPWTNKLKTKWLDVDSVTYWEYTSKEQQQQVLSGKPLLAGKPLELEFLCHPTSNLMILTNGYMVKFNGDEADEIYQLLNTRKGLLNG